MKTILYDVYVTVKLQLDSEECDESFYVILTENEDIKEFIWMKYMNYYNVKIISCIETKKDIFISKDVWEGHIEN